MHIKYDVKNSHSFAREIREKRNWLGSQKMENVSSRVNKTVMPC